MKKQNLILIIVGVILAIGVVIGAVCLFGKQKSYSLNLPVSDTISSITITGNSKTTEINKTAEITDIISVLSSNSKRTTKTESVSDSPKSSDFIQLDFAHNGGGSSRMFVYQDGDLYYLEQPYNGIYRISPDEYNEIYKRVR